MRLIYLIIYTNMRFKCACYNAFNIYIQIVVRWVVYKNPHSLGNDGWSYTRIDGFVEDVTKRWLALRETLRLLPHICHMDHTSVYLELRR